jgi:hypothetical protein
LWVLKEGFASGLKLGLENKRNKPLVTCEPLAFAKEVPIIPVHHGKVPNFTL